MNEKDKKIIIDSIRDIPDFPKKGIVFKDITTLISNPVAFNILMNHLEKRYKKYNLDYIVGLDARGFIFGSVLADRLNIGFVPIRKKGKLPYTVVSEKYELEYGFDEVEIHTDSFNNKFNKKILLVDDLLATGGTAKASEKLIKNINGNCVEACFILDLNIMKIKNKLDMPIYSVISID